MRIKGLTAALVLMVPIAMAQAQTPQSTNNDQLNESPQKLEQQPEAGVKQESVEALKEKARQGDEDAQLELLSMASRENNDANNSSIGTALMFMAAKGSKGALNLLKQKADEGFAHYQMAFALALSAPNRSKADHSKAFKYMDMAVRQGLTEAYVGMGIFYSSAIGVARDLSKTEHYFKLAAERGSIEAMRGLGEVLKLSADGGHKKEAFDWLKKAAVRGDIQAAHLVGKSYLQGEGVPPDYAKAKTWFFKAAQKGHPKSQYALAKILHEEGKNGEAYAWLTIVDGVLADDGVKQLRERVSQSLTADEKRKSELVLLRYSRATKN